MTRKTLSPIEKAHWESRARSHVDVKDGVSACPLMGQKVQLIPVRYGRVERLRSRPDGDRYKSLKCPLGLRLVRDGFLYVIDEARVELSEYRLVDGSPAGLLWKGQQVTQDVRLEPGGSPDLVFPHDSLLHVAWSPTQWTAAKCMQVLQSSPDRYYFMQQVHLAKADCQKGGQHLRVESQISEQLAEIAEQPAPQCFDPGIAEQEKQDYSWEDPPLFREAHIGQLKNALNPLYENNHLYLVLEDSLGLIADLADEQDKVVDWISDWREAHDNELTYITASYIDTLMTVGEHTAQQAVGSQSALFENTTPDQRTSIYAWINARNRWRVEKSKGYPVGNHRFDAPQQEPVQTRMAGQEMALREREMLQSLGEPRYSELKGEIEAIEARSQGALNGIGLGARGIQDLVRHQEMQAYLSRERAHLKRWQQRLETITEDRTHLLCSSEFHRSTWYFDPENAEQLEQALAVEQNCMRDLCRTDESLRKVGDFFHENPYYILPVFQGRLDLNFLKSKAGDLNKWLDDIRNFGQGLADANARVSEVDQIMSNHWSRSLDLPPHVQAQHQLVLAIFQPAIALNMSNWLGKMQSLLDGSDLHHHLEKLGSATNRAQRLGMLVALKTEGMSLKVASEADIGQFRDRLMRFNYLTDREDTLKKQVEKLKRQARRRELPTHEKNQLVQARQRASNELLKTRHEHAAVRRLIETSVEPINKLPAGHIQARLHISEAQQTALLDESRRLQAGLRAGYDTPGAYKSALKSSWAPILLGSLQISNTKAALDLWLKEYHDGTLSLNTHLLLGTAMAGAAASMLTAYQLGHIAMLDKAMQAVRLSHGSSAGALTAARTGRLGLGLGGVISGLFFGVNMSVFFGNHEKWRTALAQGTTGEKLGAAVSATGDLGAAGTSTLMFGVALQEFSILLREISRARPGFRIAAANQAWATRGAHFLSFSARLNIWGLGALALQIAGEPIYNYYQMDDMQRWLLGCFWGSQPQGWTEGKSGQKLAEATQCPIVIDNGIITVSPTQDTVRSLSLILPGLTIDALETDALRWRITWSASTERLDVSEFFKGVLNLSSHSPLILELRLPTDYLGHQVFMDMCLAVKPLMAEHFLKFDAGYLNYRIPLALDIKNAPAIALKTAPNTAAFMPDVQIRKSDIDGKQ